MTLRVRYDDFFKAWSVENLCGEKWFTCNCYYPKVKHDIFASFRHEAEAREFMEWMQEDAKKREEMSKNFSYDTPIPSDYYGKVGKYYGD